MNAMSTSEARSISTGPATLAIRELAQRTGVAPATLRMWEQRHGFPVPHRLDSGHRRYAEADVRAVADVVARRDAGTRLDVAIAQVQAERAQPGRLATPSVFAELRRRHPNLQPFRLRKSTLLGLSWAIEDEFCAKAERAHLFGAFQRQEFYEPARARWAELSRVAASAFVLADFATLEEDGAPVRVPLAADAPMRREWAVVCDSRELPAALTAWELPGQEDVPDRQRLFESMWTVDPHAVRDAARVCAAAASDAGASAAAPVLYELADEPSTAYVDLATVTTLFNRVVGYVDDATRRRR